MINRKMESELDRDVEDFVYGKQSSLNRHKIWRQYKKNLGRFLKVSLTTVK